MRKLLIATLLLFAAAGTPQGVFAKAKKGKVQKEIAVQLYSVRDLIGSYGKYQDSLKSVLGQLGKMGYTAVEAAGYDNGTFYGKTPEQFRSEVEAAGMKVLSSHCSKGLTAEELASGDFTESLKWWDQCIAAHKAAGMSYIVTPHLGLPKTVKDLQTNCDYYNQIGAKCLEQGLKYGYHNHAHEFEKVEGKTVMLDYMLENTDPEKVFFELDVYWAVRGHACPVDYFNKYPGRFKVLHIKDEREIGQSGMVGFDAIFRNAQTAGVENIVVEVERYSCDVPQSVKMCIDYLIEAPFVKESYCK